jgi:hypothetical protein
MGTLPRNPGQLRTRPRLSLRPYDTKCLLKNRFYIGEITYRGEVRSGEDEPILGHDLFER